MSDTYSPGPDPTNPRSKRKNNKPKRHIPNQQSPFINTETSRQLSPHNPAPSSPISSHPQTPSQPRTLTSQPKQISQHHLSPPNPIHFTTHPPTTILTNARPRILPSQPKQVRQGSSQGYLYSRGTRLDRTKLVFGKGKGRCERYNLQRYMWVFALAS